MARPPAQVPAALAERGTPGGPWDLNPLFNSVNMSKRSITLDLAAPEGIDLFRLLVPRFDFVAENFSPRVLGNLGIAYPDLCRLRSDIVLVSMSGYGATGPWSAVPGIGGTIEPSSGMSAVLGYADGPPLNSGHMYPDPVAGLYGFGAVVTALAHRRRTGEGQYVDLSMQEACATFIGMSGRATRTSAPRPPAGVTGTRRTHRTASSAAQARTSGWPGRAGRCLLGRRRPGAGRRRAAGERFATAEARLARQSDLETAIGPRTAGRDKRELARALAAAGVIAAPVLDVGEVLADSDLSARGMLRSVTHSLAAEAIQAGLPLRMANTPLPPWGPSPLHGEHSLEVLQAELGLDEQTYAALAAAGITGCGPVEGN